MNQCAEKTLVSVIVPVYNCCEVLDYTLDSIRHQTLSNIEIICVDDGSTDGSSEILEAYCATDNRMKYVRQENAGAGIARNVGLSLARGRYCVFLDSDDIYSPNMLEVMTIAMEHSGADMCMCAADVLDSSDNMRVPLYRVESGQQIEVKTPREFGKTLFQTLGWAPWNKMFRRDFVEREGLLFQSLPYINDLYFVNMAKALAGRIVMVNEPIVAYRTGRAESIQGRLRLSSKKSRSDCFLCAAEALKENLVSKGVVGPHIWESLLHVAVNAGVGSVLDALPDRHSAQQNLLRSKVLIQSLPSKKFSALPVEVAVKRTVLSHGSVEDIEWAYKYSRNGDIMRVTLAGKLVKYYCGARIALIAAVRMLCPLC